ncbi:MAG: hypothetical protein JSS91_01070 [Bacteroidetes bacterium]|nr:hypothetical protein [Bacteroidota bacterium]
MSDSGIKYENFKNKICPYCQSRIKKGADISVCSECGTPHHKECWDENNGCTSYGCRNNPLTERDAEPGSEDVGNLTIETIRQSLNANRSENLIPCPSCGEKIEKESVFCKFCGKNIREEDIPSAKKEAAEDFKKEFKKRYKDKTSFTRKRLILTYGSFAVLAIAIGILTYISINRLNEYFASDKFKIQLLLENYEYAVENRRIDSIRIYLTDDYEYFSKTGKRSDKNERLRKFENIFNSSKKINYDIKDFKLVSDTSVSADDKKIQFREVFEADKLKENGIKLMRVYKGETTGNNWKIYREISE